MKGLVLESNNFLVFQGFREIPYICWGWHMYCQWDFFNMLHEAHHYFWWFSRCWFQAVFFCGGFKHVWSAQLLNKHLISGAYIPNNVLKMWRMFLALIYYRLFLSIKKNASNIVHIVCFLKMRKMEFFVANLVNHGSILSIESLRCLMWVNCSSLVLICCTVPSQK